MVGRVCPSLYHSLLWLCQLISTEEMKNCWRSPRELSSTALRIGRFEKTFERPPFRVEPLFFFCLKRIVSAQTLVPPLLPHPSKAPLQQEPLTSTNPHSLKLCHSCSNPGMIFAFHATRPPRPDHCSAPLPLQPIRSFSLPSFFF